MLSGRKRKVRAKSDENEVAECVEMNQKDQEGEREGRREGGKGKGKEKKRKEE